MILKQFIKRNRVDIESHINRHYMEYVLNYSLIVDYIKLDKILYKWAFDEGVRVFT